MRISQNNIKEYTAAKALSNLPYLAEYVTAEEVKRHTYVNNIWRVTLASKDRGEHDIYLRQALDHIKVEPEAKVSPQRIFYEHAVLQRLSSEIFCDFDYEVVPQVYFLDKKNFILILSDVRKGSPILVDELFSDRVHPEIGENLGKVLATMHRKTWGIGAFELDKKGNEKQLQRHFYNRLEQAKDLFPELTQKLVKESNQATKTFVAGDFASKNIFVHSNGTISFVDLERSFVGDPAFDIGFLLGHYQLEVLQKNELKENYAILKNHFDASYAKHLHQPEGVVNEIFSRGKKFIGTTILYRLYGRAKSGGINKNLAGELTDYAHKSLQS